MPQVSGWVLFAPVWCCLRISDLPPRFPYGAAIVGPYDKCTAGLASSITWFYVDHPSGVLPAEGQRPESVGCVAKAMQTLRLLDGGGGGVQAEISGLPNSVLQQLAQRYVGKPDAGALSCAQSGCAAY